MQKNHLKRPLGNRANVTAVLVMKMIVIGDTGGDVSVGEWRPGLRG